MKSRNPNTHIQQNVLPIFIPVEISMENQPPHFQPISGVSPVGNRIYGE
jgi:hypothetical protein